MWIGLVSGRLDLSTHLSLTGANPKHVYSKVRPLELNGPSL